MGTTNNEDESDGEGNSHYYQQHDDDNRNNDQHPNNDDDEVMPRHREQEEEYHNTDDQVDSAILLVEGKLPLTHEQTSNEEEHGSLKMEPSVPPSVPYSEEEPDAHTIRQEMTIISSNNGDYHGKEKEMTENNNSKLPAITTPIIIPTTTIVPPTMAASSKQESSPKNSSSSHVGYSVVEKSTDSHGMTTSTTSSSTNVAAISASAVTASDGGGPGYDWETQSMLSSKDITNSNTTTRTTPSDGMVKMTMTGLQSHHYDNHEESTCSSPDITRVGAVAVPGIANRNNGTLALSFSPQSSQQYEDDDDDEEELQQRRRRQRLQEENTSSIILQPRFDESGITNGGGRTTDLVTAIPVPDDDEESLRLSLHLPDPYGTYYIAEEIDDYQNLDDDDDDDNVDDVRNLNGWKGFLQRNKWTMGILILVLVTGIVLAIYFGIEAFQREPIPNPYQRVFLKGTNRFRRIVQILLQEKVSNRTLVLDPNNTSSQYRVATWLADDDEAMIDLSNETLVIQRYSLAVLFLSTGGGGGGDGGEGMNATNSTSTWPMNMTSSLWTDTLQFTSPLHECDWYSIRSGIRYGVAECSDDGLIIKALQLSENGLNGTIPDEFGWLSSIRWIDFSNNPSLEGSIPTTIGLLTNLENYTITNSSFDGTLPREIGNATALVEIHANSNRLTGVIPSGIGLLRRLETLSLEDNRLSGSLPTEMGSLSNLQFLWLKDNILTGTIPTTFSTLLYLVEVDFSFNKFVDGADHLCRIDNVTIPTVLSIYKTDCLSEFLPPIPQELSCSCCTECCSEDILGCRLPDARI